MRLAILLALTLSACANGPVQIASYPDPRICDAEIYPPPATGFPQAIAPRREHRHAGARRDALLGGNLVARGDDADDIDRWVRFQNAKLIEGQRWR